jgi:hypothetical protein
VQIPGRAGFHIEVRLNSIRYATETKPPEEPGASNGYVVIPAGTELTPRMVGRLMESYHFPGHYSEDGAETHDTRVLLRTHEVHQLTGNTQGTFWDFFPRLNPGQTYQHRLDFGGVAALNFGPLNGTIASAAAGVVGLEPFHYEASVVSKFRVETFRVGERDTLFGIANGLNSLPELEVDLASPPPPVAAEIRPSTTPDITQMTLEDYLRQQQNP